MTLKRKLIIEVEVSSNCTGTSVLSDKLEDVVDYIKDYAKSQNEDAILFDYMAEDSLEPKPARVDVYVYEEKQ